MNLRAGAALLISVCLGLSACGSDDRPEPPQGFFGVAPQAAPTGADLARMAAGGVESYHMILSWAQIERREGEYDWTAPDDLIERLAANGIRPLPYVFATPPFYADLVIQPPTLSDRALRAFDRFLAAAAARYGPEGALWEVLGRTNPDLEPQPVRAWEIWNEVNGPSFWSPRPSPDDYATLLRVADRALRRGDPGALLISAGMFATPAGEGAIGSFDFLRRLFAEPSVLKAVDYVGIHPYGPDIESVRTQLERTRRIVDRAGAESTGMWVTEIGWGSDPAQGSGLSKTPEEQAELLAQTYEMLLAEREAWGIEGALWYTWRDPADQGAPGLCGWCRSAGLVDSDLDAKPSWVEYAALAGGEPD